MASSRRTASSTKSKHTGMSQLVTSDSCQVKLILSKQVFEVSSISCAGTQPSMTRGRLPRQWHTDADQTRPCSNQALLKFAFLVENLYKFTVFGGKKLICEVSDKGSNVKGLNKLLKKLRDSGSMKRRTRWSRRCSVRSDALLVFTRYSTNI